MRKLAWLLNVSYNILMLPMLYTILHSGSGRFSLLSVQQLNSKLSYITSRFNKHTSTSIITQYASIIMHEPAPVLLRNMPALLCNTTGSKVSTTKLCYITSRFIPAPALLRNMPA